jgi:hypothetical protein
MTFPQLLVRIEGFKGSKGEIALFHPGWARREY